METDDCFVQGVTKQPVRRSELALRHAGDILGLLGTPFANGPITRGFF